MKQWGLFLLSIGTFIIMMAGLYSNHLGMFITGGTLCGLGAYLIWGKKRK